MGGSHPYPLTHKPVSLIPFFASVVVTPAFRCSQLTAFWTLPYANLCLTLDYAVDFSLDYVMDMDSIASTPPTSKIRRCARGRSMSSLTYDFHSVCSVCRGNDCDCNHPCDECSNVDAETLNAYLKHKTTLQRKLQCKRKAKAQPAPLPIVPSVIPAV